MVEAWWLQPLQVDPGLGFDAESRVFVPSVDNPEIMVIDPAKAASFEMQRFPLKKPARTLRIAVLGGSSVRNIHEHLQERRTRLAENLTRCYDDVEYINAGGDAYGSHRLVLLAVELLLYEPDLVFIYSGHNEFNDK